jgi:uncharacterized protein (TIGR03382 family)
MPRGKGTRMKTTIAIVLLACAAGCGPTVTVDDDVDINWDFIELIGPSSDLHTPYVVGASMNLYVHSTDDKEKMDGWKMESSDPSIFVIDAVKHDSKYKMYAEAHTTGDGIAHLRVRDSSGEVVLSQPIESRLPDRAQIMAHGLLIIGKSEAESQVNEVRLLSGGTATFLVRYYLSDRTLYGNGTLGVTAPPEVVATTPRTYLFEDRDWLQVTPNMTGSSTLGLTVNGQHFAALPLIVVDGSQAQSVRILGGDESHAKKDQWLVALGQAFDDQMRRIYGVEFTWEVDGQAQTGWYGNAGDLYRYKFDPTKPKMLAANFNGMAAVAQIHSGGGYVDSSNHIGCSAAPGLPSAAPWALLMFAVFLARRRISL